MIKILRGQGGFMLLNVVFLTVITSFAAMILLNAAPRVRNPRPTLELTAFYLANEQLAYLESMAARGENLSGNFHGDSDDLINPNVSENAPINFNVATNITGSGNLRTATVTVTWQVNGKNFEITAERKILFVQQ